NFCVVMLDMSAKEQLPHAWICKELCGFIMHARLSKFKNQTVIRHSKCGFRVLLDHEDGYTLITQANECLKHLLNEIGREADRRLINQNELWIEQKSTSNLQLLLL